MSLTDRWIGSVSSSSVSRPVGVSRRWSSISSMSVMNAEKRSPWERKVFSLSQPARPRSEIARPRSRVETWKSGGLEASRLSVTAAPW
jgi:hypothetical protein